MEFVDQELQEEYVASILRQAKEDTRLTPEVLHDLLNLMREAKMSPSRFPISVTRAARILQYRETYDLKRIVDPSISRRKSPDDFKLGKDFIYVREKDSLNRIRPTLYMTLDTFKEVSALTSKSRGSQMGKIVLEYLFLVEEIFRSSSASDLKVRKTEFSLQEGELSKTPPISKTNALSPKQWPDGLVYYTLELEYKSHCYYYHGYTDSMKVRIEKHRREFPVGCSIKVIECKSSSHPQTIEFLRDKYAENYRVPIPEKMRGMRSLYPANPALWKEITAKCEEFGAANDKEWKASGIAARIPTPEPVSSPELYPAKKKGQPRRKRQHSYQEGNVARYPGAGEDFAPYLIQRAQSPETT